MCDSGFTSGSAADALRVASSNRKSQIANRKSSWRRGYESNIPRPVERADNGFEDREGHQAPITLRAGQGQNVLHRTSDARNPMAGNPHRRRSIPFRWVLEVGCRRLEVFP